MLSVGQQNRDGETLDGRNAFFALVGLFALLVSQIIASTHALADDARHATSDCAICHLTDRDDDGHLPVDIVIKAPETAQQPTVSVAAERHAEFRHASFSARAPPTA